MRKLKCECGTCKTCSARQAWRRRNWDQPAPATYPQRHEVVIWETSDGMEFTNELEAAQHQLGIYRNVLQDRRVSL